MRPSRIYSSLLTLCLCICCAARPSLNIVAVVDGMRAEDVEKVLPYLNNGGLRTVCSEGQSYISQPRQEVYGGIETVVSLLSGTAPADNGIAMNTYMTPADNSLHLALEDKSEAGIISRHQLSPRPILTPLLADRFRFRFGKQAGIYAVGLDPQTTIALAGHSANGCCWLDEQQHLWATTTFYKQGLPPVADEINLNGSISQTLAKDWQPRLSINMYNAPTEQELQRGFLYSQSAYPLSTPAANTLVVNLALALQRHYHLGKNADPDMLLLQFTVLPPDAEGDYISSAAAEDMYLCLNQDLGYLIEQIERSIGSENLQVTLIGMPRRGISPAALTDMGMPVKQFSTERAAALSAAYLMALYGYEKWVLGGYGNTIYFNRPLIEKNKLSLSTMQEQVADLLVEFEAVQAAYPLRQACEDPNLCRSLAKRWAGDVVFTLQKSWQLTYNEQHIIDFVAEPNPALPVYVWQGNATGDTETKTKEISVYDVQCIIANTWK